MEIMKLSFFYRNNVATNVTIPLVINIIFWMMIKWSLFIEDVSIKFELS